LNWFLRAPLILALVVLPVAPRLFGQEALEIRADQDSSAEPTPIPERTQPAAPAEGESDTEATPKPKKKSGDQPIKSVQEMSPDEFKKAGLDKLSPDELRTLNEWLKGYRHAAEEKAAAQATHETTEQAKEEATAEAKKSFNRSWLSNDRIFSRIDGEFRGLRPYTKRVIIRLEDGTVWKQA